MQRKLLLCSWHCLIDPSSGAAISLRELAQLLQPRGWQCRGFCGPVLDYEQHRPVTEHLHELRLPIQKAALEGKAFEVLHTLADGLPISVFSTATTGDLPQPEQAYAFCALLERLLQTDPPDLVITYGGNWIGRAIMSAAGLLKIPVVFWLRNCGYRDPDFFAPASGTLVPCEFSRSHYESLGISSTAIPSPVTWSRVQCPDAGRRHLTFINPQPAKGVYLFARIAMELARIRPDIPLLVVEGRAGQQWLATAGLNVSEMPNLRVMPNTTDPREFLGITKALLMPSVWQETFARLPVEAFINGIPVLASNRGGLPENLRRAGFLLDVPAWCTERTRQLPSADEVRPWIETILRLWDDQGFYASEQQRALAAAADFSEPVIADRYDAFLRQMLTRPAKRVSGEAVTAIVRQTFPGLPDAGLTAAQLDSLLPAACMIGPGMYNAPSFVNLRK